LHQQSNVFICLLLGFMLATTPALGYGGDRTQFSESTRQAVYLAIGEGALTNDSTAQALLNQGREHYKAQRFSAAAIAWTQAANAAHNDTATQALAFSYLTAAYQQLGQWNDANRSINQSLELITADSQPVLGSAISAQVYNTLGSLQFAQGLSQNALETWQTAAEFYLQGGDEQRYLNNLLNQAQAQQVLGYYNQVANTLATIEAALPQQSQSLQRLGYQRLGQAYRLTGNLEDSLSNLETALSLSQAQSTETSPILIELGNTALAQDDALGAIAFYEQAIAQSNNLETRIKAQLNRLQVLATTDPTAARQAISALSTALANMAAGRNQTYAYIHGAQSLMTLGSPTDLDTVARWLANAVQQSNALQDSRAEAYARGYLGHTYELSNQWGEAQALTEAALTIAQTIQANDIAYQWQWQLGRLLNQQNQKEQALQAYRDAYTSLQSIRQDLVSTHQTLQFSFRDSVEPIYRELVDLLLQPEIAQTAQSKNTRSKNTPSKNANGLTPQQEARDVIESLQVAELDNFFRTACLAGQQVALEDVESTDAAVVYPIILRDRLELLVSLPGTPLQQYTSTISQSELEQTLLSWRQNLEKPFTTPEGKLLGQSLYNWIIQPMQPALVAANVNTLTFVLDGALRNAPMSALYNDDHYLVEDYAVALAPGLQLLGPKALQETSVTALLGGLTQARHGFGELQNVKNELLSVESLVNSSLLVDEDFTSASLSQQLSRSNRPIIHLATHGQFSSSADDTFILAWDRPILVNELSSILRTGDLNRPDPIELLILSACETASGDKRAALGLAGVALQSGTRSTLASLWNLNDESGAVFVTQFYKAFAQPNITKAKALQQAQLSLLQDRNYRHPTYWSAYVLLGNWL
ncbi:MAG: CHAT domain-containing protein, partial [Cyanobacteria bacterium J06629_19]